MEKGDLIFFKNKIVNIVLRNGFFYQGKLLKVSKSSVLLDDRFKGEMLFDISEINSIRVEKKDGKN